MTGLRTRRSVICSCQKKGWERIENNHWAFGIPLQGYLFELIKHNVIQFMGIIEIQEELLRSKDERWETLRFCCGIFPQQILFWSAQKHRWFHQQKLREARSWLLLVKDLPKFAATSAETNRRSGQVGNPPALDSQQDRYHFRPCRSPERSTYLSLKPPWQCQDGTCFLHQVSKCNKQNFKRMTQRIPLGLVDLNIAAIKPRIKERKNMKHQVL